MQTTLLKQTKLPQFKVGRFSLPKLAVSPYFSLGSGTVVQKSMTLKCFILGYVPNGSNASVNTLLEASDSSISAAVVVPLSLGYSDTDATLRSSVESTISTYCTGTLSIQAPDIFVWDIVSPTDLTAAVPARAFSTPSLAINTSRQPSTTRDTMVNVAVDITSALSLSGGSAGKVELKYADNTGLSTNVVTVQSFTNSNTGTLTIGLNTSQVGTASLTGIIPAGKFYRIVTTNVTGTPTYGTPVIQEVLL